MAQETIMSQFYACLSLPLPERLAELTRIIDQSGPSKDLQSFFPHLINNIFGISFNNGWGLRNITIGYEFEILMCFLEAQGPIFRLCYKLLSDTQLRYNLALNFLPIDLQTKLEKGRYSQFYADLLTVDPQSLKIVGLSLNPFDYYIFNFALHLINNNQYKSSWDNWNSVYFSLACDYLMHFLPADPNIAVLPHIPNYTGKVPIAAPLQTANRPCTPSLLLLPDVTGINNQHSSPQTQSRNEIWRSETVLQVFIDLWMSVEQYNGVNEQMYQRNYPATCSSPERVRTVRVLVKHMHSYSAKHLSDPAIRSSALRKYARQVMCTRAYHYIKSLVTVWPLDASFRLVMELWLSLIQPWRYTDSAISQDRFPRGNNNQEENPNTCDPSFTQFIAENFPSYTCILKLVLPRFMRLDLTTYKNAVMLFRLGKVFSQPYLVPILRDLESAIISNRFGSFHAADNSYDSSFNQSNISNMAISNKWVSIAKQALSELNMSPNFEYEPIWSEQNQLLALEFVSRIHSWKLAAEKIVEDHTNHLNQQNKGIWGSIKSWLMINANDDEMMAYEESKKVPTYLNNAIHYFSNIFGFQLNENLLAPTEFVPEDTSPIEHSSYANSSNFAASITNQLRRRPTDVQYMGDPDLMPIASYESTILVRILYQIATRLNELYREELTRLWHRNDYWGYLSREVLQKPCTVRTYVKEPARRPGVTTADLPPRLSFRALGSHAYLVWITLGYIIFRMFSFGGVFYIFSLVVLWTMFVGTKALLKFLRIMS